MGTAGPSVGGGGGFVGKTTLPTTPIVNKAVSANTNIYSADLAPSFAPSTFVIYAVFDGAGTLSVIRTDSKGVKVTEKLNAINNFTLTASGAYAFAVPVDPGETINLQYSVSCNALKLTVREIPSVYGG